MERRKDAADTEEAKLVGEVGLVLYIFIEERKKGV